ncbi:hypothetical protein [Lactococcus sp.]|uniref:hypothetical protein n=1 Tax=Lactococcus sp. TaxID=44273 RepID=UPI0035B3547C
MTVDRSYHPSKAIREYQDRGMMKWQGFFLSEHTSAMKEWKEEERLPQYRDDMSAEEKFLLLSQSMLNRMEVVLKMKPGRLTDEKVGIVKELISQREILLETGKEEYKRILVSEILDIRVSN